MTETCSDFTVLSNIDCMPLIMDNISNQGPYISSKKRKQKSPSSSSSSSTQSSRSSSRRCHSRDTTVLQSPRLLPFPYHNDSLFLPTVEQHRQLEKARSMVSVRSGSSFDANSRRHCHQHTNTTTNSSIHSVLSSSLLPPPSPTTTTSSSLSSSLSSSSKRRKVIRCHHHHHLTCIPPPPPPSPSKYQPTSSSSCPSRSWIQKAWKILRKSSWRRQLSSSARAMTASLS